MKTTEQTASADAMPVPPSRAIQARASRPGCTPGGHEARDVTGGSDPLDRRHYQVRHDSDETVHERDRIAGKRFAIRGA
jgi:hypothetical protein